LTTIFRYIKNSAAPDAAGLLNAKLSIGSTVRFPRQKSQSGCVYLKMQLLPR
jgi:hypothetical protein